MKGIVLAGGKSSRFGGDKALVFVEGVRMIERSISLLEALGLEPVVVTAAGGRKYRFLEGRVEQDLVPDRGPLGGMYTACRLFEGQSLLVLTCDMPRVSASLLRRLVKNHGRGGPHEATVFRSRDGRIHPFPGVYESSLAGLVFSQIETRKLSMLGFLSKAPNARVLDSFVSLNIFSNINQQEDL